MNLLTLDFIGRALLVLSFTAFAVVGIFGIFGMLAMSPKPDWFLLDLTARLSGFVFMLLLIAFTIVRLPAKERFARLDPADSRDRGNVLVDDARRSCRRSMSRRC